MFDRKRKLSDLPSPLTDQEVEQSSGVKKLKVGAKGDYTETTVGNIEDIQQALEKATGIKRTFLVYASHDPGRSIILSFLIPENISHILRELRTGDLTILADSGVLRLEHPPHELISVTAFWLPVMLITSLSIREEWRTSRFRGAA